MNNMYDDMNGMNEMVNEELNNAWADFDPSEYEASDEDWRCDWYDDVQEFEE